MKLTPFVRQTFYAFVFVFLIVFGAVYLYYAATEPEKGTRLLVAFPLLLGAIGNGLAYLKVDLRTQSGAPLNEVLASQAVASRSGTSSEEVVEFQSPPYMEPWAAEDDADDDDDSVDPGVKNV